MKKAPILLALAAIFSVGAISCAKKNVEVAIDQENLCEVSAWQHDVTAKVCKAGQKVVYLPDSWGNEQLPILFAAVNCDHRYNIALTKGAVSCIYLPIKPAKKE